MMIGFYKHGRRRPVYVNARRDAWLVYGTEAIVPPAARSAWHDRRAAREVVAVGREGHKLVVHFR
jgi:hypothetical protein